MSASRSQPENDGAPQLHADCKLSTPVEGAASRVEIIGDATLILGDCRDFLPTLGKVDAVVTDPPYGIRNKAQSGYDTRTLKGLRVKRHGWKMIEGDAEPFDPTPLLALAPKVVLWGANHYANRLPASAAWVVWDKRVGVARDDNADCEMAWTNLRGVARVHQQLWKGICRSGEENIANGGAKLHPHQKPVALLDFCFERCGLESGQVVLDPYMGSGSCGVAAVRRGLRYIGCEIDAGYFDTACARIADAIAQPRLFEVATPKPVQGSMFDGEAA